MLHKDDSSGGAGSYSNNILSGKNAAGEQTVMYAGKHDETVMMNNSLMDNTIMFNKGEAPTNKTSLEHQTVKEDDNEDEEAEEKYFAKFSASNILGDKEMQKMPRAVIGNVEKDLTRGLGGLQLPTDNGGKANQYSNMVTRDDKGTRASAVSHMFPEADDEEEKKAGELAGEQSDGDFNILANTSNIAPEQDENFLFVAQ